MGGNANLCVSLSLCLGKSTFYREIQMDAMWFLKTQGFCPEALFENSADELEELYSDL